MASSQPERCERSRNSRKSPYSALPPSAISTRNAPKMPGATRCYRNRSTSADSTPSCDGTHTDLTAVTVLHSQNLPEQKCLVYLRVLSDAGSDGFRGRPENLS